MAFAVFLGPSRHLNRLVQPTSLLGGLQAAPAVQRGPERGQPQSAAILPSPPGAPVRPHCLRGKEVLRMIQVRIFSVHAASPEGVGPHGAEISRKMLRQFYVSKNIKWLQLILFLEVSCCISGLLSVDLLSEFKRVSPDEQI